MEKIVLSEWAIALFMDVFYYIYVCIDAQYFLIKKFLLHCQENLAPLKLF